MKKPSIQGHLQEAKRHMTEAQALALEAKLKARIARDQEMLRRIGHLRQLHQKEKR